MKLKCKTLAETAEATDIKCALILKNYNSDLYKWKEVVAELSVQTGQLKEVTSNVVTERCGFTRTTEFHEYMQILTEGGRELPTSYLRWHTCGSTIPLQPIYEPSRSKVPYPIPTASYNPTVDHGAEDAFMAMKNADGTMHSVLTAIAINDKALDDASLYTKYDPSILTHNN
jgi:hypothetical protein